MLQKVILKAWRLTLMPDTQTRGAYVYMFPGKVSQWKVKKKEGKSKLNWQW